jgi:hypothetical protein
VCCHPEEERRRILHFCPNAGSFGSQARLRMTRYGKM